MGTYVENKADKCKSGFFGFATCKRLETNGLGNW